MKRLFTITALVALFVTSCTYAPVANFIISNAHPVTGEVIQFENLSTHSNEFVWDFGDGTISYQYSPIHAYAYGGVYTVTLQAYGEDGDVSIQTQEVSVLGVDPVADFWVSTSLPTNNGDVSYETDLVFTGEEVEFNNTSTDGISYLWDFDDGTTSDIASPIHLFDRAGVYNVTLTAFGTGTVKSVVTREIEVIYGVNSAVRITVLDVDEDYAPLDGASVLLYDTYDDWVDQYNPYDEVFTSPLGKCYYEGLAEKEYYVDAYFNDQFNNEGLGLADVLWIQTQVLEPDYIHDFFAFIEFTGGKKTVKMERIAKKRILPTESQKKSIKEIPMKANKFSRVN